MSKSDKRLATNPALRRLILLLLLSLLAASCGGSDDGTTATTTTTAASVTTAAPSPDTTAAEEEDPEELNLRFLSAFPTFGLRGMAVIDSFWIPEVVRRVNEETPHTITIDAHWATAISPGEEVGAFRDMLADIGTVVYTTESATLPLFSPGQYVPWQTSDNLIMAKAWRETVESIPAMSAVLQENNILPLAYFAPGPYGLLTTFQWDELDELRGRTIAASGASAQWVSAIGAQGTAGLISELYTNLQTGVMDGQVAWLDTVVNNNFHEVSSQWTVTGWGNLSCCQLSANLERWNTWPESVREIMIEVATELEERIATETAQGEAEAFEMLDALEGFRVYELPDELRRDWALQLPDMATQWVEDRESEGWLDAREVLETLIERQEAAGHVYVRRWLAE